MPNRSWRKSLADELGTGASSELKSSKSTRGAAGGFATPFGMLCGAPEEADLVVLLVERVSRYEPALFAT